jgi:uncharacterized protein YdeI (YjbR/CyaY-like superfamily)
MKVEFFDSKESFRTWLLHNHLIEKELIVGFYKVGTGRPSMTWSESVDQALCFGWIDGVRRSIDEISYCIRFTPRKPTSIWSAINIQKVENLTKAGLMMEAGLIAYKLRTEEKSKIYSHESESVKLSPIFENEFKQHENAWQFFTSQAPSYRKVTTHWIMSAKQEKTQLARLEKVINASENRTKL